MIEGWDLKHRWKRARAQAAREAHFAVADPQTTVSFLLVSWVKRFKFKDAIAYLVLHILSMIRLEKSLGL